MGDFENKIEFKIFTSPGHSPGSICLYIEKENTLIAGDVLFQGSCGRSDLWQGNGNDLKNSIRRLLRDLPGKTKVIAGHGPSTTLDQEKRSFAGYGSFL
ncbi:hypothetical protein GEMRC1_002631 [Eukaryota sp. GEM-RC1]